MKFLQRLVLIVVVIIILFAIVPFHSSLYKLINSDPKYVQIITSTNFNESIPKPIYSRFFFGNYEKSHRCDQDKSFHYFNTGYCGTLVKSDFEIKQDELYKKFGFNIRASDKIDLNRLPADLRHHQCAHYTYPAPKLLKKAIIILIFHNEAWGPLLRTIHSIFFNSPKELISKIVLLDDASTRSHLHEKLVTYINKTWPDQEVLLFRNKEREGLIRAKIIAARISQNLPGQVLIYLDAHCEPENNWLPPLLAITSRDPTHVAVPLIDIIDSKDFGFHDRDFYTSFLQHLDPNDHGLARGIFNWKLEWKRFRVNPYEYEFGRQRSSEPYPSPAMAGGLFAIDKDFFKSLNYYDEGLDIWGAEQYELSFKIWMCGGAMLDVPCSRVGHIFRGEGWAGNGMPKNVKPGFVKRNNQRVVEVWMDEYKFKYYETSKERRVDIGDVREQKKFREKCKSFDWFMKNVAYDLDDKYNLIS